MKFFFVAIFFITTLFGFEVKKAGDFLPDTKLKNQYGEVVDISLNAEIIFYTPDKVSFDIAREFLNKQNSEFLKSINCYFLADVSSIPNFVKAAYIIPSLKKHKYEVFLIEDEFSPMFFESEPNKISIVFIMNKKIIKIEKSDDLNKLFL